MPNTAYMENGEGVRVMLDKEKRIECKGLRKEYICNTFTKQKREISEENILVQGNDEEFVKACYLFFFDREAEETGLQAHLKLLENGMTREGFLYHFSKMKEFRNRFQLKYIEYYKKAYLKYLWDPAIVLQYEGWHFIEHCYCDLLEREPDEAGMFSYTKLLYEGMPKEGIVYLFINSEEGKNVKSYNNIEVYKQVYDAYIMYENGSGIRKRLKNLLEKITKSQQIYSEMQANFAIEMLRMKELESRMIELENEQKIQKGKQNHYLENRINLNHNKLQKELESIHLQLENVRGVK